MPQNNSLLITVAGPDHAGITANLMEIITQSEISILDIGQSVTHGLLSLSILLKDCDIENDEGSSNLLKELLFCANKMNLDLTYKQVQKREIANVQEKFILNCVSPNEISPMFLKDVAKSLASYQLNILRIDNVDPSNFKSLEILTNIPAGLSLKEFKKELLDISNTHQVDVAFLKDNVYRRSKRLIVFDMDSTLIQTEVIDEMALANNVGEYVKEITEKAMNGEIDFNESLTQRVSKLKGLKESQLKQILANLPYTPGVEEFIKTVKALGYKVAIISGGFTYFAEALKEKLGIDYAFANELEIVSGELTGKIQGTIVNAEQKALLVKLIAQQEKIGLEQVVAVGDGANDLPMLATAGLGIAYHAKDIVKKNAEQSMSHGPMTSILYFLGIPGVNSL